MAELAHIEVPSALPQIMGGLRIGVTLAVVGAIVAEWAGGDRGLGVLINLARGSMFDIPLMFATLFTIALLGVALYLIVVAIERRLVRDPHLRSRKEHTVTMSHLLRPSRMLGGAAITLTTLLTLGVSGISAQSAMPIDGTATPADRRPGIHPERPVRTVLSRRGGRLLR